MRVEQGDILQVTLGAIAFKPDAVLLTSTLSQSLIIRYTEQFYPQFNQYTDYFIWAHAFFLVLAIGLFIGGGFMLMKLIAAAATIGGVGGALLIVENSTGAVGENLRAVSQMLTESLLPYVNIPVVADLFVAAPFLLTLGGLARWQYAKRKKRERAIQVAEEAQRAYCPFCGIYVGPTAKRCGGCNMSIPKTGENYCTGCGRQVPVAGKYCCWCGEAILLGKDGTCQYCQASVNVSARYCYRCGKRQ